MHTRYSKLFPQTRRSSGEDDSVSDGYAYLERAGFVRRGGAAGVYSLLPLGWRVHRKVCDVIYSVMEENGVFNVTLPILQPRELWERTGRWEAYVSSKTMFRTQDSHRNNEFGLAPTAEEMVTALVAGDVKSWRELPLHLHQIGPKFRDEIRPRQGLIRGREFWMSDAYSFDRDELGMRESFDLYQSIYEEIFKRIGLEGVVAVQADSGAIGGSEATEYMALNEAGEDTLLTCGACEYAANAEKAGSRYPEAITEEAEKPSSRVSTPGVTTVDELQAQFPLIAATRMVKTLVFVTEQEKADRRLIAVCIRGDLAVNEVKLAHLVGHPVGPASAALIEEATGAPVGFTGPIGLGGVDQIFFDRSVEGMKNILCGGNEKDTHVLNANIGRDFEAPGGFVDLHLAKGGDGCPECGGVLVEGRGIELGHVFMLQRGYAKALGATFTDESGNDSAMWMGCYGIGTTRLVQAIAEQCHDEDGLIWPAPVAPFDVHVVLTRSGDPTQTAVLDQVLQTLDDLGLSSLVDDRDVSPGVKFKDADLLGCSLRLTVGRDAGLGKVEVCDRRTHAVETSALADLGSTILQHEAHEGVRSTFE